MIRNLILDMGGVILDVDYTMIIKNFAAYGVDARSLYTQAAQLPFIDEFEKGNITPDEFRNQVRNVTKTQLTDSEIDSVWNSMILYVRKESIALIGELKTKYDNIFLFSNTNEIHMQYVRTLFQKEIGFDIFTLLFNKSYLSNEIHLRKPDKESFVYILNDASIDANQTLFIDDTPQNIQGASLAGIQTHLLAPPQTLNDLHNLKII
ncbi:MAG: HAD family phosphatase [Bacteroidales bacterium]|nr:HAD family phosphatase [Bacteroidales bacterium]